MNWLTMIPMSFAMSPQVFLRYLPTLIFYTMLIVGVFLVSDNPWVVGMLMIIIGTMGTTFLFLTGIRAALMTAKATMAPDIEKLLNVTAKMMVTLMLVQLVIIGAVGVVISLFFYHFVLPGLAPEVFELAQRPETRTLLMSGAMPADLGDTLRLPLAMYTLMMSGTVALCFGLFGVPMAAMAANPVKHSPQNDLIFGLGRYFVPQFFLYIILSLPAAGYVLIAPHAELFADPAQIQTPGAMGIALWIWGVYMPSISYAAMALGYRAIRGKVAAERAAERVPIIDYDAERENLRNLRLARTSDRSGTRLYDPNAR